MDDGEGSLDRRCALVTTSLERQKGRNLLGNQRVSLLLVDPGNTSRFIQARLHLGRPRTKPAILGITPS